MVPTVEILLQVSVLVSGELYAGYDIVCITEFLQPISEHQGGVTAPRCINPDNLAAGLAQCRDHVGSRQPRPPTGISNGCWAISVEVRGDQGGDGVSWSEVEVQVRIDGGSECESANLTVPRCSGVEVDDLSPLPGDLERQPYCSDVPVAGCKSGLDDPMVQRTVLLKQQAQ